jgi:hypothetical protein
MQGTSISAGGDEARAAQFQMKISNNTELIKLLDEAAYQALTG